MRGTERKEKLCSSEDFGNSQRYVVRYRGKQPKRRISFRRVLGFLLFLAYCFLLWSVILTWAFVGWQTSAVGIALCILTFLGGWFSFVHRRKK